MRKVTAGLFMSIDGVVESPYRWRHDSFDAEIVGLMGSLLGRVDTAILGRVGYEDWSSDWPDADPADPFGRFINAVPKFVASHTLEGPLEWNNSTLIEGDVEQFVTDLKSTDGGEIALFAGISLVRRLFLAGVLDELTLMIHPVVAGEGRHLFQPGDPITQLQLLSSQFTTSGNAVLTYALRAPGEAE